MSEELLSWNVWTSQPSHRTELPVSLVIKIEISGAFFKFIVCIPQKFPVLMVFERKFQLGAHNLMIACFDWIFCASRASGGPSILRQFSSSRSTFFSIWTMRRARSSNCEEDEESEAFRLNQRNDKSLQNIEDFANCDIQNNYLFSLSLYKITKCIYWNCLTCDRWIKFYWNEKVLWRLNQR